MIANVSAGVKSEVDYSIGYRTTGRILYFSAAGLYDWLVLLIDDEARSHWDHITAEAVKRRVIAA